MPDTLPLPKWAFCSGLADSKQLLIHGSGDPNITEFQPRTPQDRSADTLSKQTAVFAASDGIMQQPPYKLGLHLVYEPHWARLTSVRPLARIRVILTDFLLLDQVRGHNDEYIRDRAAADPYGFP